MLRRKLTGAIILAGALNATTIYALGLGEMTLHSALNQPLEAEIKLLNVGDLSSNQILVGLASRPDFENAGVERDFFLTNLKFDVVVDSDGNGYIKIKTHKLVNEPYLNFLVEARWPAGKLLREYTALLDLPIFTENADTTVNLGTTQAHKEKVETPRKTAPAQQAALPESRTAAQKKSTAAPTTAKTHYQGDTYRIERNDTLWSIAKDVKPSENVTIQQTIVALQQINPEAFVQNNINRMKAGHILRIPDETQIKDIHAAHALREVAAQNREWRSSPDTPAQIDATARSAAPEKPVAREKGHLKLSSANTVAAAQTDARGGGDAAAMQSSAADQEMLDKVQRENQELKQQSTELQQRLENLERLVQLKDQQLSALQGKAAQTPAETVTVSEETAPDTPAAEVASATEPSETTQPTLADADIKKTESEKTETAKVEQKPVAGEMTKPAASMKRAVAPEKSFMDQLLESPLYIGGALIVLLLVLGGLFMKRRAKTEETESALFKDVDSSLPADMADFDDQHDDIQDQLEDDQQEQALDDGDLDQYEEDLAEAESGAARSETGDAIGEADIYVAYGRYQHAIDLLKNAIAGEPQRTDLRVKLLDVYLEAGERDGFKEQFVELQNLGNEQAVAKAKEMLSTVEGASDWLDGIGGGSITESNTSEGSIGAEQSIDEEDSELTVDVSDIEEEADTALELGELEFELDTEDDDDGSIEYDLEGIDLARSEETPASEQISSRSEYDENDDSDLAEEGFELDLVEVEPVEEGSIDDGLAFDEELEESLVAEDLGLDLDEELAVEEELSLAEDDLGLEDADLDTAELVAAEELPEELTELDLEDSAELDDLSLEEDSEPADSTKTDAELDDIEFDIDGELELESFDADDLDAAADAELAEEARGADSFKAEGADDATDEFDFLSDTDEVATKLDLARAYIDMGDIDGAKDILEEVLQEGSQEQKSEAGQLLERIE